jgi:glycogen debranching enzyme
MTETIGTPAEEGATGESLRSEHQIEARTSFTEHAQRTLKHGDAFAVLDSHGDIGSVADTPEGLYYRDTRYLSRLELRLGPHRPLLLDSAIPEDRAALSVELTNPDVTIGGQRLVRDSLFFQRTKFLWNAVCYERLAIRSYGAAPRQLRIYFLFDADFRDMFEIRGTARPRHGTMNAAVIGADEVQFRYAGLDRRERRTSLHFDPAPTALDRNSAVFEVELGAHEQRTLFLTVTCREAPFEEEQPRRFLRAYREIREARRAATAHAASVESPSVLFDEVAERARSDVYTLTTRLSQGFYPYAGIPWFNTIFGRDGLITAMMMLWADPRLAEGVLRTLAATQATGFRPEADAQPGKILHEMRHGEMANLGEVPFARYYGSVDATPLFVMLAGMYLQRTGDLDTVAAIWPNITAALNWIDRYGDIDGDGFVEYARTSANGLANQGWKDSHDSVFHKDGSDASGPIALCEVQAYTFAAKQQAALIARRLGVDDQASELEAEAERLRGQFEDAFWCPEIGTYALALDGAKRPCRVIASNAGHALFAGIASPERARKVADCLLSRATFSGWGIRTLAFGQPRYNPISYHNGSVWPHDNALIAIGLARYGFKAEASQIFAAILDAASERELHRLPELFCGFHRRMHRPPTPYPVACSPQAWAAASVFGLLGASLGLQFGEDGKAVRLVTPVLPAGVDDVTIRKLPLGDSAVDVQIRRNGAGVVTASQVPSEGRR